MATQIDPSGRLGEEVARIALALDDDIAAHLHDVDLHDARKAIKKLRALLRLVRPADPERLGEIETHYRDAARAVSGARDATAAVEMIDRLIAEFPGEVERSRLGDIRDVFRARSEHAGSAVLDQARDDALALRDQGRQALLSHPFDPGADDARILRAGLRDALHRWRKAQKAARGRGEPDDFHDLRKVIKALGTQLGLLRGFRKGGFRKLRRKVTDLGERLGELNDIHVMRQTLAGGAVSLPDAIDPAPFEKLLKKQAAALEKQVLRDSRRLYGRRPRKLRKLFG